MIPFSVDAEHTKEEIAQFASQLPHIPESVQTMFKDIFGGAHSDDYYLGLLTGYANSLTLQRMPDHAVAEGLAESLVAFVANHIENSS